MSLPVLNILTSFYSTKIDSKHKVSEFSDKDKNRIGVLEMTLKFI